MNNHEYELFSKKIKNLATIGMLTNSLFHDVYNMLAGIEVSLGRMKIILDSNKSSKEKLSQAHQIADESIGQLDYLRNLLNSSTRLFRDENAKEIRLDELLYETIKMVSPYARHERCEIILNAFAITLMSQEVILKRVIINLLFYIIKHMDPHQTRQIIISMDEHCNVLLNSDNMGFQRTFAVINTPKEEELLETNEFNLYIARKSIEELGGKIFASEDGENHLVTIQVSEKMTHE